MFVSGQKFFGQFLKVAIEREKSQLMQIMNVTQYEVPGELNVFSNNLILYDLDCIKCNKE